MSVIASAADVRDARRRATSNGTGFWLTTYIGANRYVAGADAPAPAGALYPMAFLVEQDPDATVGAHFHQADQFQVVVGGAGRLGTHAVAAGAVHFAGAWTAYGPLTAGATGLQYFTLRNGWDPGARYMASSENRALLRGTPRRHREAVGAIEPTPDGLSVQRRSLVAGAVLEGPDPRPGAGQFWLVLSGDLAVDDVELPVRSCVFVRPDEPALTVVAGRQGSEILLLQFPRYKSG